jgi:hypothetical protein
MGNSNSNNAPANVSPLSLPGTVIFFSGNEFGGSSSIINILGINSIVGKPMNNSIGSIKLSPYTTVSLKDSAGVSHTFTNTFPYVIEFPYINNITGVYYITAMNVSQSSTEMVEGFGSSYWLGIIFFLILIFLVFKMI